MDDDDYKLFSTSLEEMVKQVQSNLPHAKEQGFKAVSINVSLDVAQSLIDALESHPAFKTYITRRISELEADKKKTMDTEVLNKIEQLEVIIGQKLDHDEKYDASQAFYNGMSIDEFLQNNRHDLLSLLRPKGL